MEPKTKLIASIFGVSVLTTFILIMCSLHSLSVTQNGLDYSSISKTVAQDVYGPGIHMLGVGHTFIKYPSTFLTFDFSRSKDADSNSVSSRTRDGLEVAIETSFQYTLNKAELRKLYFTHADEYHQVFKEQAINLLADVTTNYDAEQFFTKRQSIGLDMQTKLNEHFQKNLFSTIHFFQLRSVDLPDKFEQAIMQTEVMKQDINKAMAEKNTTIVVLETLLQAAAYDKDVIINLAKGKASNITQLSKANADAYSLVQTQYSTSYKELKADTSMTNAGLLYYIKAKVQRMQPQSAVLSISKIDT